MVSRSVEPRLQPVDVGVEARVLAGGLGEFVEQHVDGLGLGCHGLQRIQGGDVARALPDAHQRCLAVQPRHAGLLDVAVAAEAFQRLGGVTGRALAHLVLAGRQPMRRNSDSRSSPRTALSVAAAIRIATMVGRFGLDRQVGEHVPHQRLVNQ